MNQSVLRWFGHMEWIDEESIVKRVMNADVEENRARGRPKLGWMDGLRTTVRARDMTVEQWFLYEIWLSNFLFSEFELSNIGIVNEIVECFGALASDSDQTYFCTQPTFE